MHKENLIWPVNSARNRHPQICTQLVGGIELAARPVRFLFIVAFALLLFVGNAYAQYYTGYIEVCKAQCVGKKHAAKLFDFELGYGYQYVSFSVPVGACSGPINYFAGTVSAHEKTKLGIGVTKIEAYGYDHTHRPVNRLVSSNYYIGRAQVTIVPGDISTETIAVFTNCYYGTGLLKVCKVAGPGVDLYTPFTFSGQRR